MIAWYIWMCLLEDQVLIVIKEIIPNLPSYSSLLLRKARCWTKFEFGYIWLEPILKINYPHGIRNMVSMKPSGEFPSQGLDSHTKPTMNIIFIINNYFSKSFILLYVEFCFQDQIKDFIKYLIKILQRFKEIMINNITIHWFN
jgi:hypothetical protein